MRAPASQSLPYILFALALLALANCSGAVTGAVGAAAAIYLTRTPTPPEADITDQIQPHENWCYSTMGYAECYARIQDVPAERLINVDPQSHYPLTPQAYRDRVALENPPPLPPEMTGPTPITPVTRADPTLKIKPSPATAAPKTNAKPKHKKKKHKKAPKPASTNAAPTATLPAPDPVPNPIQP